SIQANPGLRCAICALSCSTGWTKPTRLPTGRRPHALRRPPHDSSQGLLGFESLPGEGQGSFDRFEAHGITTDVAEAALPMERDAPLAGSGEVDKADRLGRAATTRPGHAGC